MGSAASSVANDVGSPIAPNPELLTIKLQGSSNHPSIPHREAEAEDDDGAPPELIDASDHDEHVIAADSHAEVCRKALLLPTTSAQHVGRLMVTPNNSSTEPWQGGSPAGQVDWILPKTALMAGSGSSGPHPSHSQATAADQGTDKPAVSSPVLLSPTCILPCCVTNLEHSNAAVKTTGGTSSTTFPGSTTTGHDRMPHNSLQSTTEWQLVLEPVPIHASCTSNDGDVTQLSASSHHTSNPPHGPEDTTQGFTCLPSSAKPQPLAKSADLQLWRPSIRFLWSPSCNSTVNHLQQDVAAGGKPAPVAAVNTSSSAGSSSDYVHTSSYSSSTRSSSSDSLDRHDPGSSNAGNTVSNSSSSSNGSSRSVGSVTRHAEKLLPSSWSIRKKNLAPASYKAAYAKLGTAAAADAGIMLAPSTASALLATDSAGTREAIHGEDVQRERDTEASRDTVSAAQAAGSTLANAAVNTGGLGWQLLCSGTLSVAHGGKADDGHAVTSTGFQCRLEQLGGTWGAPFNLCCSSHTYNCSSSTGTGGRTIPSSGAVQHQLCISQPVATNGGGAAAASSDFCPGGTSALPGAVPADDELCITVNFTQLLLQLSEAVSTTKHTSQPTTSLPHQQHPLGEFLQVNTPTKASAAAVSQQHSACSSNKQGAAVISAPPRPGLQLRPAAVPARQLEAVLLSHAPRMLVIDKFFSPELCRALMELARDRLVRSRVASGSETPSRTSWGHFFVKDAAKHPLIVEAEAQIEALFNSAAVRGGYGPLAKVEALQVVRYHKGEFYHEHYDNRADGPLTRAATILVYLCDTEEGGATSFSRAVTGFGSCPAADALVLPPKVTVGPRGRGIKIFPVQGRALVFWSKRPNGNEDPNSIHAAEPVLAGEKWIATRWMKDNF